MRLVSTLQSQNEMSGGLKWIIICVVLMAVIIIAILVGILVCFGRRKKKKDLYSELSEDNGIKSSKSAPSLSDLDPSSATAFTRPSLSTDNSPYNSGGEIFHFFPQPDVVSESTDATQGNSDSTLSLTDQYSPFQRSFHVGSFPYLEFSPSKKEEELTVAIMSLHNIPDNVRAAADAPSGGIFFKAHLLPDEKCRETKIYRPSGAESQSCNECLSFQDVGKNNALLLSAYFIDQRHVRISLGHINIPIESGSKPGQVYRSRLEQLSQALHSNIGEVELSLTFEPQKSRLKVDILRCKDLTLSDVKPTSEILLRVQFLHGRKLSKEKDFTIAKLERNPEINGSCTFSLTHKRADISHLTFLLIEVALSQEASNEFVERYLGRVDIGPYLYARGEGLQHWQTIINKTREPICMSHLFESSNLGDD